jgi:hypothetical protein
LTLPGTGYGDRTDEVETVRFAHESERRFARILDFYGVPW